MLCLKIKSIFLFLIILSVVLAGCGPSGGDDDDDDDGDDDDDTPDDDDDDDDTIPYEPPDGMEVVFYDIGQGDASLVRFPGGSTMLIDGGIDDMGDDVILPHFKEIHLKELDYMVVSHPHADHIGGLDEVLDEVSVNEFWHNGDTHTTWQWDDLVDSLDEQDVDWVLATRGFSRTIDGCDIEVLSPGHDFNDLNKNSIVMIIECEGIFTMFTGDATKQTENDIIGEYGFGLASDLIKIPHHGSPDRALDFPDYVLPQFGVISCGAGNPYGHPSPDMMDDWEDVGTVLYRTDLDGSVTASVKSGNINITTEK